jgi:eukaryotic-like serine/threonine-protein kinase
VTIPGTVGICNNLILGDSPVTFAPGKTIGTRYRLIAPLGDGATGTVWRAYDGDLEIEVALKLIKKANADRNRMLAHFAREADLSARMLSPNVVRVLDRGVDEKSGMPFISYELLEGDELGERLAREARLSLAMCAAVVVQACRGLARAHAVGVVHQDIKPENIFLCQDGDGRPLVKLIDFGIAQLRKPTSGGTTREAIGGTLEYMAPEILLEGKTPDARSDLYALGVVAYECFTGRVPYAGDTLGKVLTALAQTTPEAPSSLRVVKDGLGAALDAWFARAIHRDPAQRFQTGKEMAEAFVQVHRPKVAHPPASTRQPTQPTRPPSSPPPPREMRATFPSLSEIDLTETPPSMRPRMRSESEYSVISDPPEPRPREATKKK